MEVRAGVGTKPDDITGVGWYLGFVKYDMQHRMIPTRVRARSQGFCALWIGYFHLRQNEFQAQRRFARCGGIAGRSGPVERGIYRIDKQQ